MGTKGTDIIDFIHQKEVPAYKNVTYATFICNYCLLKQEAYRIRIIVSGNRLTYYSDVELPAANLLETKVLINSTILDADKEARFISADIKDHFFTTPIRDLEYMGV